MRVAEHLPALRGEAFNLGSAEAVSARDLVTVILAAAQRPDLRPRILGQASGEIDRQCLSAEKARRLLGWHPTTGLSDGLSRTIDWYKQYLQTANRLQLQEVYG
jgi:CDP-glucose 4,6-dehydratase